MSSCLHWHACCEKYFYSENFRSGISCGYTSQRGCNIFSLSFWQQFFINIWTACTLVFRSGREAIKMKELQSCTVKETSTFYVYFLLYLSSRLIISHAPCFQSTQIKTQLLPCGIILHDGLSYTCQNVSDLTAIFIIKTPAVHRLSIRGAIGSNCMYCKCSLSLHLFDGACSW